MGSSICLLFWLGIIYPTICSDLSIEPDLSEDRWLFRSQNERQELLENERCSVVRPTSRDVVRRFYAILPYLDKDHANAAFLHKFRTTVYSLADSSNLLEREAAFYSAVLMPLLFLQIQQYRDMWCLLERFHRALRLYQISHPTEQRSALKLLQNFRAVNLKIRQFITNLPGEIPLHRSTTRVVRTEDFDEEVYDKKDIRYLKELIKSLG